MRGVGQHRLDVDAEQRRAIDAREILAGVERQRSRRHAGDEGAEIAVAGEADREEFSFGIERQLGMDQLRAALAVGEEAGRTLVGPFHRPAQRLCRMQDAGIFGIVQVLHAEGAADIGGEDAHLLRRDVQDLRHDRLVAGHALGRHLQGVALARLVVMAERDPRLHRHHGDAGVDDIELCHVRGAGKGRLDPGGVAIVVIERHVVGDVVIKLRRARLGRLRGIGHGRQRLDVELDGFRRIARLRHRLGHDKGDRVADIAHLVGRQRHAVGLQEGRAVAALERQAAAEGVEIGAREVRAGPYPEHARHALRR